MCEQARSEGKTKEDVQEPEFEIVGEDEVYSRYLSVYNRKVRFPKKDGVKDEESPVHEFDVIGHPRANFHFCVVFPYHPPPQGNDWRQGEVTLIKEYAQGPNQMVYGLPAGSFHVGKHESLEDCARAELSEEAHLKGGKIYQLLSDDCPGVVEVKWCRNRFTPFLVYDPKPDETPGNRDTEEYIEIVRLKISEIKALTKQGKMLPPAVLACYWSFDWLEDHYGTIRSTS